MSSDVVLSAALRNNLLSLQSTQRGIDSTQLKLSTGKKVNSALDNPQAFFASQALTNRASDLTRLLDGIGQSIQVIKAADNGVTALTALVNQADSIATQASEAQSAAASGTAKITGTVDLSGPTALVGATGTALINNNVLSIRAFVKATGAAAGAAQVVTLSTGDRGVDIASKITTAGAASSATAGITATLDDKGHLVIEASNSDYFFRIDTITFGAALSVANTQTGLSALGIGQYFGVEENAGGATQQVASTVIGGSGLTSAALTTATGTATKDTLFSALTGAATVSSDDNYTVTAGGYTQTINLANVRIGDFLDQINNGVLKNIVKASFDETTGQISLSAKTASVGSITVGTTAAATLTLPLGFASLRTNSAITDNVTEAVYLSNAAASATIDSLETQYNNIRTQIDALVTNGDTGYRGTNLLNGDDLLTVFNEDRTSSLTTSGVVYDSAGLGISVADFSTASTIDTALDAVRDALETVRNFGSALAGDLSVIQTRQSFTSSLINTLKEGSDLLVNADQNEEGAKLLALQTCQSLGVTALSLAPQSQQSILRPSAKAKKS